MLRMWDPNFSLYNIVSLCIHPASQGLSEDKWNNAICSTQVHPPNSVKDAMCYDQAFSSAEFSNYSSQCLLCLFTVPSSFAQDSGGLGICISPSGSTLLAKKRMKKGLHWPRAPHRMPFMPATHWQRKPPSRRLSSHKELCQIQEDVAFCSAP